MAAYGSPPLARIRPTSPLHLAKRSSDLQHRAPFSHCSTPLGYNLIRQILINLSQGERTRHVFPHFPGPPCNYRYVHSLVSRSPDVTLISGSFFNLNFHSLSLVHSLPSIRNATHPSSSTASQQTTEEQPAILPSTQCDALPLPIPHRKPFPPGSKPSHQKGIQSRSQRQL